MTEEITLSDQQQAASDRFSQWLDDFQAGTATRPFFVLQGFAGTGKSFTINHIIDDLELEANFMAYTGKAALVLRKYSGVEATTIHSACYKYLGTDTARMKELYGLQQEGDLDEEQLAEIKREMDELRQPRFELNREAFPKDSNRVLVLDECSMVDNNMLKDLTSYGIPIIALGDRGQLRPISGTGALFGGAPDAELTEIRRQALESPIIRWSMLARERKPLPPTNFDTWQVDEAAKIPAAFARPPPVLKELFDSHDMAICWKNATRRDLNQARRKQLGWTTTYPTVGETIQLQNNDNNRALFNGQFGQIMTDPEIMDYHIECDVLFEDKDDPIPMKLLRFRFDEYFEPRAKDQVPPWMFKNAMEADFGYVITCHKAQGSQWDRVLVFEENVFNWHRGDAQAQRAEWLYTAMTRAAQKVTIVGGKW